MKQVGYYHCFPFGIVEKDEEIIIWGAGEVGKQYATQVLKTGYCIIRMMVDSNWKSFPKSRSVMSPVNIKNVDKIRIVIANGDGNSAAKIKESLINMGVEADRIIWWDRIIAERIVVSDAITSRTNDNRIKRIGYYHVFPFDRINKGEPIAIWGCGEVGNNYIEQVIKTNYTSIKMCVDERWKQIKRRKVCAPDSLKQLRDCTIVVAIGDADVADQIIERIKGMGISGDRIIWNDRILENEMVVDEKNGALMGRRMPYIYGEESGILDYLDPLNYAKNLLGYDVISFDVFDTLIFRPFTKPTDLFFLLEEKYCYFDFASIRINAERKARRLSKELNGNTEVTLEDIYQWVERETSIDNQEGCRLEFDVEKDLCYANPYMLEVVKILQAHGKKIICISDMYLGERRIREILESCGYKNIAHIFVSCDYSLSKTRGGGLYRYVKNRLGENKKYVHIGDNYQSDVLNARKRGFDSWYYKNVNEIGNKYRATFNGMSNLIGSIYGGLVNGYLHNGLRKYNRYYEHGFIYGGLYVLGYVNWINHYAKLHNVDKILFLSRDGDIYQKVYELLPDGVENVYAYWSRLPSLRLEIEKNRHFFIKRFIRDRIKDVNPMTIRTLFCMAHLEFLEEKLKDYHLSIDQEVCDDIVELLVNVVIKNWDDIIKRYGEEDKAARIYYSSIIKEAKNVAVVDVGWVGSGPMALKWLIEEKWKLGCKVHCLTAGSHEVSLIQNMTGKIKPYIFSKSYNRDLYDFHCYRNNALNYIFFELFTQSCSPTFEGFSLNDDKVKFHFGYVESENHEVIKQIHQGIVDFAKIYIKKFTKYRYIYDISGFDAYKPFQFVAYYPEYFEIIFGDYLITSGVGGGQAQVTMETLREFIKKQQGIK